MTSIPQGDVTEGLPVRVMSEGRKAFTNYGSDFDARLAAAYLAMRAADPEYATLREALENLVAASEDRRVVDGFHPESRVTVLETRTKDIVAFHEALDDALAALTRPITGEQTDHSGDDEGGVR